MDETNISVRATGTDDGAGPDHVAGQGACRAVADILARVGDKWTVMLVGSLSQGPLRSNQLHRMVGGISQRMLTLTLKGLEQDGLVTRTMYPAIPPRVEYELTALGQSLIVPLRSLHQWAQVHGAAMAAAREDYARRQLGQLGQARFTDPK